MPAGLQDLPLLDEARLRALMPMTAAVVALEAALHDGTAPGGVPARTSVLTTNGQLLLMPAATSRFVGVKLVSVAPDNPELGLPRVQGVYVLLDAITLTPLAIVDGVALTSLRTPATSAVAARHLAPRRPLRVLVVGTGPQGYGHVEGLQAVRPIAHVTVAGRDRSRAGRMAQWCNERGVAADVVAGADIIDGLEAPARAADVVVCATTSRRPLIQGAWLKDDALAIAVGSHEPNAREVDSAVVLRSTVIVETRDSALREAGDIMIPIRRGECTPDVIAADLGELVRGEVDRAPDAPAFFKSTGEAWEDLVVASAAYDRIQAAHTPPFGVRSGW